MAPCSSSSSSLHHFRMSDKDIRLRKPIVEKMRRDRINSCIEQLKIILEKEFHQQEHNSKLEKADILEMTVSFLRQQLQSGLRRGDYDRGYDHCWRDSLQFLSAAPQRGPQLQGQQLHPGQRTSCSAPRPNTLHSPGCSTSIQGPVWRPW